MLGRGTSLEAMAGPMPVEDLVTGTLVRTLSDGAQPVVEVLSRCVEPPYGALGPVRIETGAIGNTAPIIASPKAMFLVPEAAIKCGSPHAPFVEARMLVDSRQATQAAMESVEYVLILFGRNVTVLVEGVPCQFMNQKTLLSRLSRR